jgi:hypothetical protein
MTDSAYVFAPGERLTDDSTGAPIIGGTVYFYDAGTTNPKTVYASADLDQGDNPALLGTSVVTDSLGYPTSDGSTRTLVYVGTSPYKVVAKDADGNTVFTHDDIPGAVVSASSVDVAVTATFPVVTKSLAYTVLAADQNTTFLVNCSSANVTLTLPSATDSNIPNGWKIKVQHAGSGNQAIVVVKSGSGQSISEGTKTYGGGSFALSLNGEDCEITADGGNWRVVSHTAPFVKKSQGIIPIADRAATSPGSPVAGSIYLLTGTGGSFSAFTAGDLAFYTGAGWVNFTPYTDCGWVAFVQDENLYYRFMDSAWVVETATTSIPGTIKTATQAVQETSTATDTAVTPATQQFHPSAAKCWLKSTVSTGTPAVSASYNITSITDTGQGDLTVTIATDFSGSHWSCEMSCQGPVNTQGRAVWMPDFGQAGGTVEIICYTLGSSSPVASDPTCWYFAGFGDQ